MTSAVIKTGEKSERCAFHEVEGEGVVSPNPYLGLEYPTIEAAKRRMDQLRQSKITVPPLFLVKVTREPIAALDRASQEKACGL